MTANGPHSVSSMLLLMVVEDPASDLHPILFNVSPSVSRETCTVVIYKVNFWAIS